MQNETQIDFFKITKEIRDNLSDFLEPEKNKKYDLIITSVDSSKDNEGVALCKVSCTDKDSKKPITLWIRSNNSFGRRKWISLIDCILTEEQAKDFTPSALIGKSFSAIGEHREYNGKTYKDIGKFSKCQSVGATVVQVDSSSDIPF